MADKDHYDDTLEGPITMGAARAPSGTQGTFTLIRLKALEKPRKAEHLMEPAARNPCSCNTVCPCVPDQQCGCNAVCTCNTIDSCAAFCTCVGDCGCDGYVCSAYCPSFCGGYGVFWAPC